MEMTTLKPLKFFNAHILDTLGTQRDSPFVVWGVFVLRVVGGSCGDSIILWGHGPPGSLGMALGNIQ